MQNLDQTSWDACGFHMCQMVKKYLNLHMCLDAHGKTQRTAHQFASRYKCKLWKFSPFAVCYLQFLICSSFDMSAEALYPTFKPVKGRSRRKATVNNMILEPLRQLPAQRTIHHEENRNDRNVCNKVGLC